MPNVMGRYAKAVGAVAVAALSYLVSALSDNTMNAAEWVTVCGIAVSAIGVAVVPNLGNGVAAYAKTVVVSLTAGLSLLATLVVGGLTSAELIQVAVAALTAVGVVAGVPNGGAKELAATENTAAPAAATG